jgi:cytoskeletal protein CcmA (bactofilin family)
MAKKDDRSASQEKAPGREPGLSVVAGGMSITGRLDTNGVVKVEGTVTGSVRAERQVLVAKGGLVDGDILTREAVIGGEVRGAIYADERVEVQASSQINGDITTKLILLQEGGEVNGHLRMEDPQALARKPGEDDPAVETDTPKEQAEQSGEHSSPEADQAPAPSWTPTAAQGAPNR